MRFIGGTPSGEPSNRNPTDVPDEHEYAEREKHQGVGQLLETHGYAFRPNHFVDEVLTRRN